MSIKSSIVLSCDFCGRTFERPPSAVLDLANYCSFSCYHRSRTARRIETVACRVCGQDFRAPKLIKRKFCSRACSGRWASEHRRGPAASAYGKKAHNALPAVPITCPECGRVFGEKPSRAAKRVYCSTECMAEAYRERVGPINPNWRGGSDGSYGPSWSAARRAARKRDKVCQLCGTGPKGGRALDVHHRVAFKVFGLERHAEANQLDNLIVLCRRCHKTLEIRAPGSL